MRELLRCDCGKRFPFNPEKHKYDKFIYCPFCHNALRNPSKIQWKMPSFNLGWIRRKLGKLKEKREAKKFLDKYFKVSRLNPQTQKTEEYYTFPLNKWMQGQRPTLSGEQVKKKLGIKPSKAEIENELCYLEKLGVKVK